MGNIAHPGPKYFATFGNLAIGFAPSRRNSMSKPVKQSVAVAVLKEGQILLVRRPDDDDELPGIWGLPAGSLRGRETVEDLIARIGRDKLGVKLVPVRRLASGMQERQGYQLKMELWEASMEGGPQYLQWQWGPLDLLRSGAASGSLCCRLALERL